MKKFSIYFTITIIFCFLVNLSYAVDHKINLTSVEEAIVSRIILINKILKDPKEANMKNWGQLGNPHDETELKFYMDSISDGTISAYKENSKSLKSLIKHSQSTSESEPSIVLQYLRLSLLAYNQRPGQEQAEFAYLSFKQAGTNEIIAECSFKVNDISGHFIQIPARIILEIDETALTNKKNSYRGCLHLQKIYIGDHMAYGWWYKIK